MLSSVFSRFKGAPMLIVAGGVVALTALVALAQSTCSSVQRSVEDPAFGLNSALDAEGLPTMTPENAARQVPRHGAP